MPHHRSQWIVSLEFARQLPQARVLDVGVGDSIGALELDADREIIARGSALKL